MREYQIQFRDSTRLWKGGPTFQMVPALFREFLDYLTSDAARRLLGGNTDDEYRVIRVKCPKPHYRYNGANNLVDLRGLGPK
jgi:hypothetical protein